MAGVPTLGVTEADNFFGIEDQLTIDAIRQTNENVRVLRKELISLKGRVATLENEKDTDLL
jgi:hypothetical protein